MKASSGGKEFFHNLNLLFSLFESNPYIFQLNKKFYSKIDSFVVKEGIPDTIIKECTSKTTQTVIPASEACRESFRKKDSGQAGMTEQEQRCHHTYELISNILQSIYEDAVKFVEEEIVKSGFKGDILILQRNLYTELEHILSLTGHDPRHHFMLVIPVADRPLMLRNCLDSIIEQCRIFQYGGSKVNEDGIHY